MRSQVDLEIDTEVVIIGGGFAGLKAAQRMANNSQVHITLIDRRNHHLFQPLLYQVATAGLSPADIAVPLRSLLAKAENVEVVLGEVQSVDLQQKEVRTQSQTFHFDYLILACGATHSYFGNDQWSNFAPSLKTIEDATNIRQRLLLAFEKAEIELDPGEKRAWLNFVIVGGGPTGVEIAGSLAELCRQTLRKDFKHIDPASSQITLLEAGPRLLPSFESELSEWTRRDLRELGVSVLTNSRVTDISPEGVRFGDHFIRSRTVLWAAGVQAEKIKISPSPEYDSVGRIKVLPDLSLPGHPNVFVCGDMSHLKKNENGDTWPGLAAVAMQEGKHAALMIESDLFEETERFEFLYKDKGLLATIGRKKAVMEWHGMKIKGVVAWLAWLFVHIYYLIGFKNRILVFIQWAWAYVTFKRGARLIVGSDENPPTWRAGHGRISHT